jgi:hypothetical protein
LGRVIEETAQKKKKKNGYHFYFIPLHPVFLLTDEKTGWTV